FVVKLIDNTAPGGRVVAWPRKAEYGPVALGSSLTLPVTVLNAGHDPLSVHVPNLAAPYRVVSGGGDFTLASQETRVVQVEFRPAALGITNSILTITSSDLKQPSLDVKLYGRGIAGP